jgi:hypothetical protein
MARIVTKAAAISNAVLRETPLRPLDGSLPMAIGLAQHMPPQELQAWPQRGVDARMEESLYAPPVSDADRYATRGPLRAMNPKTRIAVSSLVLFCWAMHLVGTATAQVTTDRMLESLLRPAGWRAEWSGPGGTGVNELLFEKRADRVVAKIRLIVPFEMSCENPVTLGTDRVTFDGCRDPAVTLVFDATDVQFPFQGQSPRGYVWKLKAY